MKVENPHIVRLLEKYKEISLLIKIKAGLEWDLNVNLPPKASKGRANQIEYLTNLQTVLWKDKEFLMLLEKAQEQSDNLSLQENAVIRNLLHANKFYQKVPAEIIAEKEKVSAQAFIVWQKAKAENSYKDFLPFLQEIVRIDKIIASHLGYKKNPYDALLDLFEPELTAEKTEHVFTAVKSELVTLVSKIQKSTKYKEESPFINEKISYPQKIQKRIATFIMKRMGFDFNAGRLDVSAHPFTTNLDRYDVRLTTKYKISDFRDSYSSTMHETGHALYEQGVNPDFDQTPLESGASYGIHEAMSRFWENIVGKNPAFLRFMLPIFQSSYPQQLGDITEPEFIRLMNMVKPSFIRIESDEVTYSLHIILRFEMENALINGDIQPKEAPAIWREKSKKLFGIEPKTDSEGILQDVHWSYGAFGYFPSYALGNLYGAQILHQLKKDVAFEEELGKGNLSKIHMWLNKHIHTFGSEYLPGTLIKNVSGEEVNPTYFTAYLKEKYRKIY